MLDALLKLREARFRVLGDSSHKVLRILDLDLFLNDRVVRCLEGDNLNHSHIGDLIHYIIILGFSTADSQ